MRTYGQLPLSMWYQEVKRIHKADPEGGRATVLLYTYLLSAPGSNAIGMYCKSLGVIADESSLSVEEVMHGLKTLEALELAFHDPESYTVWIPAVSDELVPRSGRLGAGSNMLEAIRSMLGDMRHQESPFVEPFIRRYVQAFHLEDLLASLESPREPVGPPLESPQEPVGSPLESPHQGAVSPPGRSEETETETKTETNPWMDLEREPAGAERHRKALAMPFARHGDGPGVGAVAVAVVGAGEGAGAGGGAGRAPARESPAPMSGRSPPRARASARHPPARPP